MKLKAIETDSHDCKRWVFHIGREELELLDGLCKNCKRHLPDELSTKTTRLNNILLAFRRAIGENKTHRPVPESDHSMRPESYYGKCAVGAGYALIGLDEPFGNQDGDVLFGNQCDWATGFHMTPVWTPRRLIQLGWQEVLGVRRRKFSETPKWADNQHAYEWKCKNCGDLAFSTAPAGCAGNKTTCRCSL